MLMLASFPKKSSFGANGQFRVFEIALRDSPAVPPFGAVGNFAGEFFLLGGQNLMRSDFDHLLL